MLLCANEHPIRLLSRVVQNVMLESLHLSPTAGFLFDHE